MTIRELAKLIDVSPATISIVLNRKKGVSEETRKRVLEAIETHHYMPSVQKVGKTKSVLLMKYCKSGMFVEENQGFISMIIDSIEEQLRMEHLGMTMMVAKTELKAALNAIDYSKYCGMIVIATEIMEDSYSVLQSIPIPFVVVDNTVPNYGYNSVCMNNYENVWMALQYCRECGHTEIGYLGSISDTENFKARCKAFRMYVPEFGFHFDEKWEFRVTPTMLGAHDDFMSILEKKPELPSCFFAENDTIALGVMKAMKEEGYKIPRDISIIGFDDIPYASISSPTLTTVHVQRNIMGKQSVFQLLQLMADPRFNPIKTRITGRLMVRDSVKDLRNSEN
ncbi:LacI family DNA-binding transcriptional regulator [Marasmitruncus massiliensis]|uniref:LacI family DNA-binding transcriptional regulator n=1 Tax=Marasmitruncus massiliensis TaxID=1944642 RepID=UPI000C7AA60C|nr:LacI family DNA-binding transcriptional regulator [Marasmitruncus massiliensis]MBE6904838.1 LacI family transcriptional regulator [Oscillospiraceae bacterium]